LRLKKRITAVGSDLYANIVISISRKSGLSADDSHIAVLNTAFGAFLKVLRVPHGLRIFAGADNKKPRISMKRGFFLRGQRSRQS
jgi:hypothetical protein